ncbi:C40 family peptidase [Micromonospora sp. NBRC 101691]|uniref:C40 family peptidase n=1 Tax=Micromonospora sp. NBRC 101691 TaxID=3032198 RepID=UPI0024A2CE24|nr:C40 family peptidase [Micromonospora sp. NBRC 101691]GLY20495.1 hydrolase [Micromonospora sp. NBRC 101691]
MELRAGQRAVVRVAVATLWTCPDAVRPIDTPALGTHVDTGAWIAGMDTDQQVGDCVLSQLLLGEEVLVTEVGPHGWVRVVAVEQAAAGLDPRGYPGWLPTGQLTAAPTNPPAPTGPPAADAPAPTGPLVVDATVTALHATPDGDVRVPGVVLGTRLTPTGPAVDGWRPVHAPGHAEPLWLPDRHTVPLPTRPAAPDEALAVAERLLDVVYIWGGTSPAGIDCSGLVHLAWRRFGVWLPRDAGDQADATTPVELGTERPGDLYFFARPGRGIHHVGIVSALPRPGDDRRMLHACYQRRRVLEERLPDDRTATLVGVHRV